MMPILLPVLVRRSVRATTVPATRPAPAPFLTARANSAHDCTRRRFERRGIIVERMTGQEKPDRLVFALQPLGRQPRFELRHDDRRGRRRAGEQLRLAARRIVLGALRGGQERVDGGKGARPVRLDRIERAGGGQASSTRLLTLFG